MNTVCGSRDLIEIILSHLSLSDIYQCRSINKLWHECVITIYRPLFTQVVEDPFHLLTKNIDNDIRHFLISQEFTHSNYTQIVTKLIFFMNTVHNMYSDVLRNNQKITQSIFMKCSYYFEMLLLYSKEFLKFNPELVMKINTIRNIISPLFTITERTTYSCFSLKKLARFKSVPKYYTMNKSTLIQHLI